MLVRCEGSVSSLLSTVALMAVMATNHDNHHVNGMAFGVQRNVHLQDSITSIQDGGIKLNIQLDIGDDFKNQKKHRKTTVSSPHLFLNNLELEFLPETTTTAAAGADHEHHDNMIQYPKLPGMHGQFPHTSSGSKMLSVVKEPSFVSMEGTQNVHFNDACWEMVWRDTANSGTLVCGFNVPTEAHRNGAALPSGTVYISFPTWDKDELLKQLEKKKEVVELSKKIEKKKNDAIERYAKETNILKKAWIYREVASHVERYHLSGIHYTHNIPEFSTLMEISNTLFMCTKGVIWSMNDSSVFPIMTKPDAKKKVIGEATIRYKKDENDFSTMSNLSP